MWGRTQCDPREREHGASYQRGIADTCRHVPTNPGLSMKSACICLATRLDADTADHASLSRDHMRAHRTLPADRRAIRIHPSRQAHLARSAWPLAHLCCWITELHFCPEMVVQSSARPTTCTWNRLRLTEAAAAHVRQAHVYLHACLAWRGAGGARGTSGRNYILLRMRIVPITAGTRLCTGCSSFQTRFGGNND